MRIEKDVFTCAYWQVSERLTLPGVALGLAWTPLGGEIMFVEASRMEGEGQLTLTGQLGDVMKESAHLAISWLRANAKTYQLTNSESRYTSVYILFCSFKEIQNNLCCATVCVCSNSGGGFRSFRGDRHPPPLPCWSRHQRWPLCWCYNRHLPGFTV